jgi:hypothetical protein
MPEDAQPYASFVVRIWHESGDPPAWRGSIQHVQSGHKCYFQSLEKPVHFIEDTLTETNDLRRWQPLR